MKFPPGKPRVALIGVSGYARIHYQVLRELVQREAIALVAAVIINPEQETETIAVLHQIGCAVFGDYREMLTRLRGQLDLCCIPTGIAWHATMTIAALDAGANVLVEKPLVSSLEEVQQVQVAELRNDRFVAVAFQDLYWADTLWLKQQLVAGTIGAIKTASFIGVWPRPISYYRRNDWAGRITTRGATVLDSPINNAFAHFLNLVLFFSGAKVAESGLAAGLQAELYRAQPIESFDTVALRIKMENGCVIHSYASHSGAHSIDPEITVEGECGRLIWKYCREFRLSSNGREVRAAALPGEMDLRRIMFEQVLRRMADPSAFVCTTAIAAEHTRCIAAIHVGFSIQNIPPAYIARSVTGPAGGGQIEIIGLERDFATAYRQNRLLSEIGCPWAVPVACQPLNRSSSSTP